MWTWSNHIHVRVVILRRVQLVQLWQCGNAKIQETRYEIASQANPAVFDTLRGKVEQTNLMVASHPVVAVEAVY